MQQPTFEFPRRLPGFTLASSDALELGNRTHAHRRHRKRTPQRPLPLAFPLALGSLAWFVRITMLSNTNATKPKRQPKLAGLGRSYFC